MLQEAQSDISGRIDSDAWRFPRLVCPLHEARVNSASSFKGGNPEEVEHTIIGASDYHNTIVALQPIDFIQEKALDIVGHQTIEIFKDQEARACLACLLEYSANVILVAGLAQRFDV